MNITITRQATAEEIRLLRAHPCATPECPFIARGYSAFCEACETCAKPYQPRQIEGRESQEAPNRFAQYKPALFALVFLLGYLAACWLDGTTPTLPDPPRSTAVMPN